MAVCSQGESDGDDPCVLGSADAMSSRGAPLASLVDKALSTAAIERSEVQEIAVGVGPGSAAGIRSTIAFAEGWRMAMGIPVSAISSVEAIAEHARLGGFVGAAAVLLRGPGEKVYFQRFAIRETEIAVQSELELSSMETLAGCLDAEVFWIGPQVETICERIADQERVPVESRLLNVVPTASAVGYLCAKRDCRNLLPLEPLMLSRPQFVKAPLPRVIPDV